jgi:hypothetical protein
MAVPGVRSTRNTQGTVGAGAVGQGGAGVQAGDVIYGSAEEGAADYSAVYDQPGGNGSSQSSPSQPENPVYTVPMKGGGAATVTSNGAVAGAGARAMTIRQVYGSAEDNIATYGGGDASVYGAGSGAGVYNQDIYAHSEKAEGVNNVYDEWGGAGAGAGAGARSTIYAVPADEPVAAPMQFIIPSEDGSAAVVMQQSDGEYLQMCGTNGDVLC